MNAAIDVRHVLPAIRVPTLVLHRLDTHTYRVEEGRYVASRIPEARLIELPGVDYFSFTGDVDALVDEIEAFVTGSRPVVVPDRILATVLTTQIVDPVGQAVARGDRGWADLQDRFLALSEREIESYRGRALDLTGARIVATFDGPARAIHCARSITAAASDLGLLTRTGLHTGECELSGDRISGVAVPLAGWVAGQASPGETLVSSTVKDLVAGARLRFADRGVRALPGRAGEWHLFAVLPDAAEDAATAGVLDLSSAPSLDPLSRREREVVPLVARGLSNLQIADALSIGERTVESHVANILAKWSLANRSQIAAAGTALGDDHIAPISR